MPEAPDGGARDLFSQPHYQDLSAADRPTKVGTETSFQMGALKGNFLLKILQWRKKTGPASLSLCYNTRITSPNLSSFLSAPSQREAFACTAPSCLEHSFLPLFLQMVHTLNFSFQYNFSLVLLGPPTIFYYSLFQGVISLIAMI